MLAHEAKPRKPLRSQEKVFRCSGGDSHHRTLPRLEARLPFAIDHRHGVPLAFALAALQKEPPHVGDMERSQQDGSGDKRP